MEQQGIMRQLPTDDQTIVDYLYRIAGEYGEKAAVLMGDAALSYHDLNARSNQLAHYLRGLGIGEDRVVAIRLPRGMAMLIAIFAIVKAGGAYLPLAYNAPRSRIENILSIYGPDAYDKLPTELDHLLLGILDGMVCGSTVLHWQHFPRKNSAPDDSRRIRFWCGFHACQLYYSWKLFDGKADFRCN